MIALNTPHVGPSDLRALGDRDCSGGRNHKSKFSQVNLLRWICLLPIHLSLFFFSFGSLAFLRVLFVGDVKLITWSLLMHHWGSFQRMKTWIKLALIFFGNKLLFFAQSSILAIAASEILFSCYFVFSFYLQLLNSLFNTRNPSVSILDKSVTKLLISRRIYWSTNMFNTQRWYRLNPFSTWVELSKSSV